jgi:hypothetical protein
LANILDGVDFWQNPIDQALVGSSAATEFWSDDKDSPA